MELISKAKYYVSKLISPAKWNELSDDERKEFLFVYNTLLNRNDSLEDCFSCNKQKIADLERWLNGNG